MRDPRTVAKREATAIAVCIVVVIGALVLARLTGWGF